MTCADLLFVLEHLPFSRHAQSASTVALIDRGVRDYIVRKLKMR